MRDNFKCEYLFLGSCRCAIEKDVRFTSECISVPVPEHLQKNEETKIYIPYEYIRSISIFHPDLAFRGNHSLISYILLNPSSDRVRDIGRVFDKCKILGDRNKYDRKSQKIKEKEIVFQLFLTPDLRYEFNQNFKKIESYLKTSENRVAKKERFVVTNPTVAHRDKLKSFLIEHGSEPPVDYFREKKPEQTLYTPKKTKTTLSTAATTSPPVFYNTGSSKPPPDTDYFHVENPKDVLKVSFGGNKSAATTVTKVRKPKQPNGLLSPLIDPLEINSRLLYMAEENMEKLASGKLRLKRTKSADLICISDDESTHGPSSKRVNLNEQAPQKESLYSNVCSVVRGSNSPHMFQIVKNETEIMSKEELVSLTHVFCDRIIALMEHKPTESCEKDEIILKLRTDIAEVREKFSLAADYATKISDLQLNS